MCQILFQYWQMTNDNTWSFQTETVYTIFLYNIFVPSLHTMWHIYGREKCVSIYLPNGKTWWHCYCHSNENIDDKWQIFINWKRCVKYYFNMTNDTSLWQKINIIGLMNQCTRNKACNFFHFNFFQKITQYILFSIFKTYFIFTKSVVNFAN